MKLGYQLFSARNYPPLSDVFALLSQEGYQHVEGYGAMVASLDTAGVDQLRADLDRHGLTMPTFHFGIDLLEQDPAQVLAIAEKVGISAIYCPFIAADQRPADSAGWKAFGRRLCETSKPYTSKGLTFGWHNHAFELEKTPEGDLPLDLIFESCPGLAWEADIAWIARSGADIDQVLAAHGARIRAVHVKDVAREGEAEDEGGWADVGYGIVDWKGLMPRLRALDVDYYVVEHDNPNDLQRNVKRSIASYATY